MMYVYVHIIYIGLPADTNGQLGHVSIVPIEITAQPLVGFWDLAALLDVLLVVRYCTYDHTLATTTTFSTIR